MGTMRLYECFVIIYMLNRNSERLPKGKRNSSQWSVVYPHMPKTLLTRCFYEKALNVALFYYIEVGNGGVVQEGQRNSSQWSVVYPNMPKTLLTRCFYEKALNVALF